MAAAKKTGHKATVAETAQVHMQNSEVDEIIAKLMASLEAEKAEALALVDSEDTKTLIQAHENAQAMLAYHQQKAEEVRAQLDEKSAALAEVEAEIAQDAPRLEELKRALAEAERAAEQARIAHGIWVNDARLGEVTQREVEHAKQKASRARQALTQHEEGKEARLTLLEKKRAALAAEVEALEATLEPMQRAIDELGRQKAQLQREVFEKRLQVAQQRVTEKQGRAAALRTEAQALEAEASSDASRAADILTKEHPSAWREVAALRRTGKDAVEKLLEAHIDLLTRLSQDGSKLGSVLPFPQVRDTLTIRDADLQAYMTGRDAQALQGKVNHARWLLQTYRSDKRSA